LDAGLLSPFFVLIIIGLALDESFLARAFSHPFLVLLGNASYALFVINVPIRWFLERVVAAHFPQLTTEWFYYFFIPFIVVVSIVFYKFFERPAQRWLLKYPQAIPLFFLDALGIGSAVALGFVLRLGTKTVERFFPLTMSFAIRAAIPLFIAVFILFKLYEAETLSGSKRTLALRLALAHAVGGALFTLAVYQAWPHDTIQGFSKSIMGLCVLLSFAFALSIRFLIYRLPRRVGPRG
jgi:peptidoglycan/LPS O-acetylase OafA/YrhL